MAQEKEDRSTEDLSDEASPYRLEEFRKQGRVAQSKELSGMYCLLATGLAAYAMAPSMGQQLSEFMQDVFRVDAMSHLDLGKQETLWALLGKTMKVLAGIGLPISIVGFIVGIAASYFQVGNVFSTEPLTPDLEKINPLKGLQRLFSMKHALDSVRMLFKAIVVAGVAYLLLKPDVRKASSYILNDPSSILGAFDSSTKVIFLVLTAILIIFAAGDFWLQKWEFGKSVRLTKQEAKEEHKEHEGDPLIKARVKALQRDQARKRMMEAVKKADVIVTNPTHIAIALSYQKDKMAAPKVVAKGADFIAQKIKKIAADAGVPTVENVPLARTLFKTVKVGQSIPRALYQAVAEVLAFVYKMKSGRGGF
ncbi:MAG: flagellar biosynthesis protein FlhB [Bacteriovoracia bacterium]